MLEAILETAVDAIVTIDADGVVVAVNGASERLFGYKQGDMIGNNVKMLMPNPDHDRHDSYIANHITTGERKIIGIGREVTARRKDGSLFPIHLAVSTFEVEGKRYFTGMLQDISKRVMLEGELSRQVRLFQALFEHVPEPLVIAGADQRILMVNPAAASVFQYPPEELVGKPAEVLFESAADFAKLWQSLSERGDAGNTRAAAAEARLCRKGGIGFPGRIAGSAIHEAEGSEASALLLARDLTTEQKQKEAQLRTQSLEALGQLTGGVAHDFNNLLTIVAGNLEFAEDSVTDARGREHLKRARSAVDAGARLTGRLLTFARRRRLNSQNVALNPHVLAMTELLQRTLGDNIQLETHLAAALWSTFIDPSEVENAILNLAINARDAMPSGGKLVIATGNAVLDADSHGLDTSVKPGQYVRLSVSDTGTGMSKEVLRRAFEPFFTTKPTGRGTGLGLSTIYGFIKQSNGHIGVYSEPNSGTTVNLYLPRSPEPDAVEEPAKAEATNAAPGETVLVVEDNPEVRAVTVGRLKRLGYRVIETETAAEALAHLAAGLEVDAVFSDVVMPGGLSGFDLARRLAAEYPDIAVLLTSGFSEGVAPGSDGAHPPVLQKPYAIGDLASELRKAIALARGMG
jgi:PAS domain S-box-containing protein